jgi:kanosamine-6-phosphate phosphatase
VGFNKILSDIDLFFGGIFRSIMTLIESNKNKCEYQRFPPVLNPRHLVFSDFDETYLAYANTEEQKRDRRQLEDYLRNYAASKGIVFGWVTGSSLKSVFQKLRQYDMETIPHFIASSLGTTLTYYDLEQYGTQDQQWATRLSQSGFSESIVSHIVKTLKSQGITLVPQPQIQDSPFLKNYFYYQRDTTSDAEALSAIRTLASNAHIGLNISRCNPLNGDPDHCYDIDFVPKGTGKDQIVEFMRQQAGSHLKSAVAFGDSGNDIKMLQTVNHGYLLENATLEAKRLYPQITLGSYTKGILSTLQRIID